ncbi:hypothetical protein ACHAWF_008823 [Thalassiosira exigua]
MANPLKVTLICLAIVAVVLGMGIGIGMKPDKHAASESFKSTQSAGDLDSIYDIDACSDGRRIQKSPGVDNGDHLMGPPTSRRTLARRLGEEISQPSDAGASAKSSKGPSQLTKYDEISTFSKGSKSERCIRPASDMCTSQQSMDHTRKLKGKDISRELAKEVEVPPSSQEGGSSKASQDSSGVGASGSGNAKHKSSKKGTMAPAICGVNTPAKSGKKKASAMVPDPSGNIDTFDATPAPVTRARSIVPTATPSFGTTQKGTPPLFSIATAAPTAGLTAPNPVSRTFFQTRDE